MGSIGSVIVVAQLNCVPLLLIINNFELLTLVIIVRAIPFEVLTGALKCLCASQPCHVLQLSYESL